MKILTVGEFFPWPTTGGGLIRLANSVEALCALGETDLFALSPRDRKLPCVLPADLKVERLKVVPYPKFPSRLQWQAAWLSRRGIPREVVKRNIDLTARLEFESWVADHYDLVWFSTAALFAWMGRPHLGPTVVDFVDLEDEKARRRTRIMAPSRSSNVPARIRQAVGAAQERMNVQDWRQFQRSVAGEVDRVTLCSDQDVRSSGLPNAVVVPNTYARPARAVGRDKIGDPPTLLLQGTLAYKPNTDAANWLVGEIAPRIWSRIPSTEVRLVGTPIPEVKLLHRPPAVTVVGQVPTMEPELARADIATVPIRFGSGTRVKILESFAHRVPVVSTTIGAEGFDVVDGVHLLLADDPEAFASACERLLTDTGLRERMVDAAEQWYLERHQESVGRDRLQALAREVAGSSTR